MQKTNIVFIGMPGSGKSTLGKRLAHEMEMPFLDTDEVIMQREERSLHQILEDCGLEGFLQKEETALLQIKVMKHVIATGGSVVYSRPAMEHLQKTGVIIYLKLPVEELLLRLGDMRMRGIAMETGADLHELYRERAPLYETFADFTVDCRDKSKNEILDEIKENVKKFFQIV